MLSTVSLTVVSLCEGQRMRLSTKRRQTFEKADQIAFTAPDLMTPYVNDPSWVPVDAYGKDERAMNMERGMLVEKGRVILRVFCP